MTEQAAGSSTDLVRSTFTTDDYAGIKSFEDAMQLIGERGLALVDAADLGDGFAVIDTREKNQLIGVPFIVLNATFHIGDYIDQQTGEKAQFVAVRLVTKDGRKLVLTDGGAGICDQIRVLHKHRPETIGDPIMVWNGLRVSEYDHPVHGKSATYYLDTAPAK